MVPKLITEDCYRYPQYWDMAFRDETEPEADFVDAVVRRYLKGRSQRILEPGCGGGRLVVELANRGYQVTGYDLSSAAVTYTRQRLRRRKLEADVYVGDMVSFQSRRKFDIAVNTVNTFRHLLTERDAVAHLRSTANLLRPGGIYILGLHLMPPDADEEDEERFSARHGSTHVHMTLRVVDFNRQKRIERLRFILRVRSPGKDFKIRSEYEYRIYNATQFRSLLRKVPRFELLAAYDFLYDIDDPVPLNNNSADTVLLLRLK